MQAYISALNYVDRIGKLCATDPSVSTYMFSAKALADPENFAFLAVGCTVEFTLENGKVRNLQPATLRSVDEVARYSMPDSVSFESGHLRDGYEILDVGRLRLSKMSRDVNKARAELASLCRSLGGNTLLEVTERQEQRTAMAYAFIFHIVQGYVAVAGRPDAQGNMDASDLLSSINHQEIKRRGQQHENKAAGKIALKLLGGVLLLCFAVGYIYSTFLH